MANICNDIGELKIIIRCVLVATIETLTVEELWKKTLYVLGGPHAVQLQLFGYDTALDFLNSIPEVVQLEDQENENSIVYLVSSELSKHMEHLVVTNIKRPPTIKNKSFHKEILIPYRIQCAFIRIFVELYPSGLLIDDFVQDVLCIPIFKSFVNCVDVLLYNLDHIFQKKGLEKIHLQPQLIESLIEIKEDDKFSAMDIYNIDENSLQDCKKDRRMANGLEYSLFDILEEQIKKNIELLLNEEPSWISETKICDLYIEKFGSSFSHFRRWGFIRVSQMFSQLPELCCIRFLNNEAEIIAKKHACDVYKNEDLEEAISESELYYTSVKNKKSEKEPQANDGVLKKYLRCDQFLKASLNDCFLDQEIPHSELQINKLLNVNVCRVNNTHIIPIVICQNVDKSNELQKLLFDMKKFYFTNDSEFIFDKSFTMLKHTYAFYLDGLWFRGIVADINPSEIKMINIDNGIISNIKFDDIRILYKRFSQLPAQTFTCQLYGIESIDDDELSQIVDKECTIYVVSMNQHNKLPNVKIKLMDADKFLNDEWIKNGAAEPYNTSDEE